MSTSTLVTAFVLGLISAASLPLGTLTSRFWRPGDRTIAFLMSFGGGALLAALTIDLAGPALAKGHFYWLAAGCIIGGLLFVVLDQIVNRHGGFLRKVSTTVFHLRRKEARRFRDVLGQLRRLDMPVNIEGHDLVSLAESMTSHRFKKGDCLFREGDAAGELFIVEDGQVELRDPRNGFHVLERLKRNDAFGYNSFLSGSPHAAEAKAVVGGSLLLLKRVDFERIMTESEALQRSVVSYTEKEETAQYLRDRQELSDEAIAEWKEKAAIAVHAGEPVPPALPSRGEEAMDVREILEQVSRIPIFQNLPEEDIEFLGKCCFKKSHARGHTFFHPGEAANRLHFLEAGQVVLIDPKVTDRHPQRIDACDEFGALSFLTGAKHSVTAVASSDVSVLVLLRRDFNTLLERSPAFAAAVKEFIHQETLSEYLQEKHHFDADKTARWVSRATGSALNGKRELPSAADMTHEIQQHQGAPLAIWLGILLDGVPESLVIGASVGSKGFVSTSLIAGLFLSNYPEALSSSIGMSRQGMSFARVLLMWTSLTLITGIGAALGLYFFVGAPPVLYSLIEGIAAGAMLTMIAQTMLPEAYFKGGSIVGFATLLGFLAAIFFKTLEGPGAGH